MTGAKRELGSDRGNAYPVRQGPREISGLIEAVGIGRRRNAFWSYAAGVDDRTICPCRPAGWRGIDP